MTDFYKVINGNYISGIGTNGNDSVEGVEGVTESEYNTIMQKIQNKPTAPSSYTHKLREDDLEWELVELPPVEEEATAYDYENALVEMGVQFND